MSDTQKAAEKALQKLSDQLTCSICLNAYRDPKVLPCLHVFCTTCLEKLVSRDGTSLSCPNCRKTTRLPPGRVAELQSAFYMIHLFDVRDTLEKVKDAKLDCQHCVKDKAAGYCRDCSEFYCQSCIDKHKGWKVSAKHEFATVEEIQAEALRLTSAKKVTMSCSRHPTKTLELYCQTCEELICHNCTVRTHRDHDYDLIEDCFHKHRDAMDISLQSLQQKIDIVSQAVGEMDARSRRLSEQVLSTKQAVEEEVNSLHHALDVRKLVLQAQVDKVAKQMGKTLQAHRDGYELTLTLLSSCLGFVQKSLQNGSPEEILAIKKQVTARVKQIEKEFDPVRFQTEPEKIFYFNHQKLTKACETFGEVLALNSPLFPDKCFVDGGCLHGSLQGVVGTLILHTVDTMGKSCSDTRAVVTGRLVSHADGGVVACEVTAKKENQFELTYLPQTSGQHDLHIRVYDRHVKNSPFTIMVGGFQGIHVKTIEAVTSPRQLAITGTGEVIVTECTPNCISVFARDGQKCRAFGQKGARESRLNAPLGVTRFGENAVIVSAQHCIKAFSLEGKCIGSAGSQGGGQLQFDTPWAVCFHAANQKVYVCDTHNHRIQVLNNDLTFSNTFGSRGSGPGQLNEPKGIAVDCTGNIYIADCNNHRVQVFHPNGRHSHVIKQRGTGKGSLKDPVSVCIDDHNFLYVLESTAARVSVFNGKGYFIREFGQYGDEASSFKTPHAIAVDTGGHIYVSDTGNDRIQVFK